MHTHHSYLLTTDTMSQLVKCIQFTTVDDAPHRKYAVVEMVLTNNHDVRGDALTITKGGISVFSYALTKGSRYGVALEKISNGYACEADGWSGRISADVVVEVTCSKSKPFFLIHNDDGILVFF